MQRILVSIMKKLGKFETQLDTFQKGVTAQFERIEKRIVQAV